jgi:intein/homing endonuclease
MEQGKNLVDFYRQNPIIAAYDLLGVDLAPIQRVVFRDMWFKNYVITVATRGYGKSTSTDGLVLNNNGLVYLDEILPKVPDFLRSGETFEVEHVETLQTAYGKKKSKRVSLEKGIDGLKLTTDYGFEHKGSKHHPLLVLDSNLDFKYKKLEDFVVGDRICIQRNQNIFGDHSISERDAYLIGLFIGDGLISDKYSFASVTTSDKEIVAFCVSYCEDFNIPYRIDHDDRTENTVSVIFKKFDWFFEKYQIRRCLSYYKCVPFSVRTSNIESQKAFLQGYFDADGTIHNKNGGVSCCSVSKKLLKEIQLMLLNFGIVSMLRFKKTNSKFGKAHLLDIFSNNSSLFKEKIGFGLDRKNEILISYLNRKKLNANKDTIPFVKDLSSFYIADQRELTYCSLIKNKDRFDNTLKDKINRIISTNYFFDTVKKIETWSGDCYDFEMDMDEEPNYFSNGFISHNTYLLGVLSALSCLLYPGYRVGLIAPVFRQSKMIFSEIEKLYGKSSILREATEKRPTRGADTCYLKFKSIGGVSGSFVESLPLGDGSKIRGSRFYLIVIDELAQVPDKILDMVIRPMGATILEPMENVRRLEQQKKLIQLGLASEDDFENKSVNKMIMTSSGYYKFNHMWRRMKDYWRQMDLESENSQYSVWQIPYWDLPEGFLDRNNIEEAKRVMSSLEFQMEYEAAMISDSEGFFKASLLESCTQDSGFGLEFRGDPASRYILGVDPNQGGSASCGVVLIKLGATNKLVGAYELKRGTTQDLTMTIQKFCDDFNIIRIFMDKGGGGKAICDLLEEGYNGNVPIIDRTNIDHKHMEGRHILEMINFNPSWIADANFATLALLEDRRLRFPELPVSTLDAEAVAYESVKLLKSQMLNIIITQTSGGLLHFDTPKKGQNKDLYSALILAGYGVKLVEKELEGPQEPMLYNKGGLIRPRRPGSNWDTLSHAAPRSFSANKMDIGRALLKKKVK